MDPIRIAHPTAATPRRPLFVRGVRAVFVEHRLPHAVTGWWDRRMLALGRCHKTMRVDGWAFRVRRVGVDADVLLNVLDGAEYHPPGYDIRPTDVVVDVGANIGAFTVPAATAAYRGRVIAVEPDADNFRLLTANVRRNGCRNVAAVRQAVAGQTGRVRLTVDRNSSGHRIGPADEAGATVPAVRLSDLLDAHQVDRCDFLKLDCEGAEFDILESMPPADFDRIRRIALEYHADVEQKRERAAELIRRLCERGFRIDWYTDVVGEPVGHLFATRVPASS